MVPKRPRSRSSLTSDTRALSTQVGYVLAIAVITILVAGLISGTSGLVTQTVDQGTEAELQIIGDRIAAQVMAADRIIAGDDAPTTLTLTADVPNRAGRSTYTVSYDGSKLILESTGSDITVTIPLQTDHTVTVESAQASEWYIYSPASETETIRIGSAEDVA